VSLTIEDDGVGFSPRTARESGFGLTGMRERAAALGGSVRISSHKDKGTRIRIVFPVEPQERRQQSSSAHSSLERIPAA
jgi:signal transduction histidine kinase